MMSSLLSEDVTIEKGSLIDDSIMFKSNGSLPTTCNNCSSITTRTTFASILVTSDSISSLEPLQISSILTVFSHQSNFIL